MSPRSFLFTFEAGPELPTPKPGQFVNIAVSDDLALMRPFSVAGITSPGRFDLLVEIRGKGTLALAETPVGASVAAIGPLGNEFTEPERGQHGDTCRRRHRRRRPAAARAGTQARLPPRARAGRGALVRRTHAPHAAAADGRRRDAPRGRDRRRERGTSRNGHGTSHEGARRAQGAGARLLLRPAGDDRRCGQASRRNAGSPARRCSRR